MVITTYMFWGAVECNVGVVAACLPSLSMFARVISFELIWQWLVKILAAARSPRSDRLNSVEDPDPSEAS